MRIVVFCCLSYGKISSISATQSVIWVFNIVPSLWRCVLVTEKEPSGLLEHLGIFAICAKVLWYNSNGFWFWMTRSSIPRPSIKLTIVVGGMCSDARASNLTSRILIGWEKKQSLYHYCDPVICLYTRLQLFQFKLLYIVGKCNHVEACWNIRKNQAYRWFSYLIVLRSLTATTSTLIELKLFHFFWEIIRDW